LCTAIAVAVLMLTPHHLVYLPHPAGAAPSSRPIPSSRPTPSRRLTPSHPVPDPGPRRSTRLRQPSDLPSGLPSYLPRDVPKDVLSVLSANLP
jgi:hypothetical protein